MICLDLPVNWSQSEIFLSELTSVVSSCVMREDLGIDRSSKSVVDGSSAASIRFISSSYASLLSTKYLKITM